MRSFLYWLKSTPAASTIKRTAVMVSDKHRLKVPCAHVGAPANVPHHLMLEYIAVANFGCAKAISIGYFRSVPRITKGNCLYSPILKNEQISTIKD